jgi:LPXTG-motif cell wall-anchored protein
VTSGTADVQIVGELGSDDDTEYNILSPTTLVSSDGPLGWDPIIGYQLVGSGASFLVTDGDDQVNVLFPAGDTVQLVLALEDYDMCGRDAALADMTARAPSLATTFGASFGALDTRCVTIDPPQPAAANTPVDQTLTVTDVSAANAYYAGDLLDYYSSEDVFLENARLFTSGLPAGLSLGYDPATQRLHLTGSAAAGDYQVRIALADVYEYELEGVPQYEYSYPLFATLAIEITAPELAATGASDATPVIAVLGGLLLLAGGGVLAARRRLS